MTFFAGLGRRGICISTSKEGNNLPFLHSNDKTCSLHLAYGLPFISVIPKKNQMRKKASKPSKAKATKIEVYTY